MAQCQIQAASRHSFPQSSMAVADRRMSLETPCHEPGTYAAKLASQTMAKNRTGAPVKEFLLCENHSQLVSQVDSELREEGWGPALTERPRFLS